MSNATTRSRHANPDAESKPPKSQSRENHPRCSAMSVKKVMVSNNNVWIIPSVMRMTDKLVKNKIVPALSLEIRLRKEMKSPIKPVLDVDT